MASTSRSEAQARSRSDAPVRPTASVFPQHSPEPVDNAISYPNFVRSTLPSTDPPPGTNAPLLLVPSKKAQDDELEIPNDEEPEEPVAADDDTVDGEIFRAARAARASVQVGEADPRAAILRFVERKKQEAKTGLSVAPIVRGVVARPARKRRKVGEAHGQKQQEQQRTTAEEKGKSDAYLDSAGITAPGGNSDAELVGSETTKAEGKRDIEAVATKSSILEAKGSTDPLVKGSDGKNDALFQYSSSEDDDDGS